MATQPKPTAPARHIRRPANHETPAAPGLAAVPKPESKPKPEFDLGRLLEHTAGQRAFSALAEMLGELTESNLEDLATFAKVLSNDRGCITPVEELISNLVLTYRVRDQKGLGVTLQDVERDLETFRQSYDMMLENYAFVTGRYDSEIRRTREGESQTAA